MQDMEPVVLMPTLPVVGNVFVAWPQTQAIENTQLNPTQNILFFI